jgi:hypothetical protein
MTSTLVSAAAAKDTRPANGPGGTLGTCMQLSLGFTQRSIT